MSWAEKIKEMGGGDFTFLSTDGETITFIVVAEPVLLKSTYKGKEQDRVGCPVVTDEGYVLLVCGKRLARKIGKQEDKFNKNALMAVRRGGEGDINSTYELTVVPEIETYTRLAEIAKADFKPERVQTSVDEVNQILNS